MSDRPLLLDTCAALWLVEGRLGARGEKAVTDSWSAETEVLVSPITAWEVGILVSKERVALALPVADWFEALKDLGVDVTELSTKILIMATELRAPELRDPADRIIAATARSLNYRLLTRDRPLLAYAARGQLSAIPC